MFFDDFQTPGRCISPFHTAYVELGVAVAALDALLLVLLLLQHSFHVAAAHVEPGVAAVAALDALLLVLLLLQHSRHVAASAILVAFG